MDGEVHGGHARCGSLSGASRFLIGLVTWFRTHDGSRGGDGEHPPLRERIAEAAAEGGVTAAVFLAGLLDRFERDRRFAKVRRAYAGSDSGIDSDYAQLVPAWDCATAEDLDTANAELEDHG